MLNVLLNSWSKVNGLQRGLKEALLWHEYSRMKAGTEAFSPELFCFKIWSLQLLEAFVSETFLAHRAEQLYFLSLIDILENIDLTVWWTYILLSKCASHNTNNTKNHILSSGWDMLSCMQHFPWPSSLDSSTRISYLLSRPRAIVAAFLGLQRPRMDRICCSYNQHLTSSFVFLCLGIIVSNCFTENVYQRIKNISEPSVF